MNDLMPTFKKIVAPIYHRTKKALPRLYFSVRYWDAAQKLGRLTKEHSDAFENLVKNGIGKQCLQIGVKDNIGSKYGEHWTSADKYDTRSFIDFNYDIHELEFDDETFDVVVCISVLEHVPYPDVAIKELRRVLKPGGSIWIQLPFNYPYHEAPKDYWRVSPDGLRVWMRDFEEILCGSYFFTRTTLVNSTFFYGHKPMK